MSICRIAPVALLAALTSAPTAVADGASPTGGASMPDAPAVTAVRCDDGRVSACSPAATLVVNGEHLRAVRRVVFLGRRGKADDRRVRPRIRRAHKLAIRVPRAARSGPLQLRAGSQRARVRRLVLDPAGEPKSTAPVPSTDGFAFPIAGRHRIGTSTAQRFDGGRNHQGQDVFADCGTPIVAATGGTVRRATTQSAAGNYVVIDGDDGRSYVSMHMLEPATVEAGDVVTAGEQVGEVGETGRATGCHLHFEIWTAPGWYEGGEPIDPIAELREWESQG